MGQLFRSPISYFSALMAKLPEVHTKWCQVQLKKSKQKFEIYILLVNGTNMQILLHSLRIQSQQQKKTFQNCNNSETLVMQQPRYPDDMRARTLIFVFFMQIILVATCQSNIWSKVYY